MSLSLGNLLAFAPEFWLLAGALVVLGLTLYRPLAGRRPTAIALVAVLGSLAALLTQQRTPLNILNGAFVLDRFAVLLDLTMLGAAGVVLLLTMPRAGRRSHAPDRAPAFILLAVGGAMMLVSAADLLTFFAAQALVTVAIAIALAMRGGRPESVIGALIAGLAGGAVTVYGLAMAYGLSGQTSFAGVGRVLASRGGSDLLTLLVLVLLVGGTTFSVTAAAFRWLSETDAVETRALAAALVMVAGFGALDRLVALAFAGTAVPWQPLLAGLAAVVMTGATIGALGERRLVRSLAFAAVGQAGFILAGLVAIRHPTGAVGAGVLLVSVAPALLAACIPAGWFAEVSGAHALPAFAGMIRRAPFPALVLALGAASLAGVPPLIGFFGRFLVLAGAVDSGYTWLALLGVVNLLLLGSFAVRVIREVVLEPAPIEAREEAPHWPARIAFGVASAGVGLLALFLSPISNAAATVVQGLPK